MAEKRKKKRPGAPKDLKRSQRTKRRKRAPAGTPNAGQFMEENRFPQRPRAGSWGTSRGTRFGTGKQGANAEGKVENAAPRRTVPYAAGEDRASTLEPDSITLSSGDASTRRLMENTPELTGVSTKKLGQMKEYHKNAVESLANRRDMTDQAKASMAVRLTMEKFDIPINDPEVVPPAVRQILTGGETATLRENATDLFGEESLDQGRINQEELWRNHRGALFGREKTARGETVAQAVNKKELAKPTNEPRTVYEQLTSSHQRELRNMGFVTSTGEFTAEGDTYLRALGATNASHNELLDWMDRGQQKYKQLPQVARSPFEGTQGARAAAEQEVQERRLGKQGSEGFLDSKYDDAAGSHQGFTFAYRGMNAPSLQELRKLNPNATEKELLSFREASRESIQQYMLEANERAAYESRQARVKGKGKGANIEEGDRVVIFTTNLGAPAVNVPADSLVGQYIIQKRKKMVVDDGYTKANRSDVKGQFPAAVRDQHLLEVGTGISLGIEGRGGLFQETGWKYKNKRSKGYANRVPLGAQVLRDKSGLPIYDEKGNVVYTEGYTKKFQAGTDRAVGLRIFIG